MLNCHREKGATAAVHRPADPWEVGTTMAAGTAATEAELEGELI